MAACSPLKCVWWWSGTSLAALKVLHLSMCVLGSNWILPDGVVSCLGCLQNKGAAGAENSTWPDGLGIAWTWKSAGFKAEENIRTSTAHWKDPRMTSRSWGRGVRGSLFSGFSYFTKIPWFNILFYLAVLLPPTPNSVTTRCWQCWCCDTTIKNTWMGNFREFSDWHSADIQYLCFDWTTNYSLSLLLCWWHCVGCYDWEKKYVSIVCLQTSVGRVSLNPCPKENELLIT